MTNRIERKLCETANRVIISIEIPPHAVAQFRDLLVRFQRQMLKRDPDLFENFPELKEHPEALIGPVIHSALEGYVLAMEREDIDDQSNLAK